jgi:hypothetical protein
VKLPRVVVHQLADQVSRAELNDARLSRRARKIVGRHASHPQAPFPEALGSVAELEAAYRFMSNPRVNLAALVEPYAVDSALRARGLKCVLAIHDTTVCKFVHGDPKKIGYLHTGKAGFMVHYTLLAEFGALRPLGIPHVEAFFRDRPPRPRKEGGRSNASGSKTTRKKNRESKRWIHGIEHTQGRVDRTNLVHVADRECDSYELLAQCLADEHRFVFRVRVPNRRVHTDEGMTSLQTIAAQAPIFARREIVLSSRTAHSSPMSAKTHPTRRAREAQLNISAMRVELDRPRYFGDALPKSLSLNLVCVKEIAAPRDEQPIEWMLFTSEPIDTAAHIESIVDMYRARWIIEDCNKALKTGCLYEHRQFESREALLTLLGLSLPIACEILALRTEARRAPNQPASTHLTPSQIQVLRHFSSRKISEQPSLKQAVLAIASLGGHQPNNGPPGWLVIQRGMTKLIAYDEGWRAALATKKM